MVNTFERKEYLILLFIWGFKNKKIELDEKEDKLKR